MSAYPQKDTLDCLIDLFVSQCSTCRHGSGDTSKDLSSLEFVTYKFFKQRDCEVLLSYIFHDSNLY